MYIYLKNDYTKNVKQESFNLATAVSFTQRKTFITFWYPDTEEGISFMFPTKKNAEEVYSDILQAYKVGVKVFEIDMAVLWARHIKDIIKTHSIDFKEWYKKTFPAKYRFSAEQVENGWNTNEHTRAKMKEFQKEYVLYVSENLVAELLKCIHGDNKITFKSYNIQSIVEDVIMEEIQKNTPGY